MLANWVSIVHAHQPIRCKKGKSVHEKKCFFTIHNYLQHSFLNFVIYTLVPVAFLFAESKFRSRLISQLCLVLGKKGGSYRRWWKGI